MKYIKVFKPISYYKLKEIDLKYNILKNKKNVLEMGSFPGGWSIYLFEKKKKFISIDKKETKFKNFLKLDIKKFNIFKKIKKKFDLIICDIFSKSTNFKYLNKKNISENFKNIFKITFFFLKRNGILVYKDIFYKKNNLKKYFKKSYNYKPKCSKKKTNEHYKIFKFFKC
ncbi:RlmE/FtsJ family methyltransferase [Candidatus Vidania fulgoroideorum]